MENKSSQGATLSPVKLWSGSSTSSLNISALSNYKFITLYCQLYGGRSFSMASGSSITFGDDLGQNGGTVSATVSFNGTNITIKHHSSSWATFTITQVWGIG